MNWRFDELADALARVMQRSDETLRQEQAVYGLDAMKEMKLAALLAQGLRDDGFCEVAREIHYPSALAMKRPSRQRCDLVLTPLGRPLLNVESIDLFTPAAACPPGEALWLELKCAYQFQEGGRAHGGYGEQ